MGALIEHRCPKCDFRVSDRVGGGMARPTISYNSDSYYWACKECKKAGKETIHHPVGHLRIEDGKKYFVRIRPDLLKNLNIQTTWYKKIFNRNSWRPDIDEYFNSHGRVYEEDFDQKPNYYLSLSRSIKLKLPDNFKKRDPFLWTLYEKYVLVKSKMRPSTYPEKFLRDNNLPSFEFDFEVQLDDRGNPIFKHDPDHCCPNCRSKNFRYGISYCPCCDTELNSETTGMFD